jgi:ABC-type nitrate/sulfonate/bicarbonate transport system substrate-binding protein
VFETICNIQVRMQVPFPNMADQLKAGNVDAVESLEPFAGQLLAAGNRSLGDPLQFRNRKCACILLF